MLSASNARKGHLLKNSDSTIYNSEFISDLRDKMKISQLTIFTILFAVNIQGCGGGGGDSAPQTTPVVSYTVTVIASEGGSASPSSQSVKSGESLTITLAPQAGYEIDSVTGCNGSLSNDKYTISSVQANCTVDAKFVKTITLSYTNKVLLKVAQKMNEVAPIISGGTLSGYTVRPNLPNGLQLNTDTGIISGTPTLASRPTEFVIEASGKGKKYTAKTIIDVQTDPNLTITLDVAKISNWTGVSTPSVTYSNEYNEKTEQTSAVIKSSNEQIAKVNENKTISGLLAGQVVITATHNSVSSTVNLAVGQLNNKCIAPTNQIPQLKPTNVLAFTRTFSNVAAPVYGPFQGVPLDLDGDGDEDLIVAESAYPGFPGPYDSRIVAYENTRSSYQLASDKFLSGVLKADHPNDYELNDFNNDGRLDVYFGNHGYDAPPFPGAKNTILLSSSGNKMTDRSTELPDNTMSFTHDTASADIDCDGDVDILDMNAFEGSASSPMPAPDLLINQNGGSFVRSKSNLPLLITTYAQKYYSSEMCDIDNDGDSDLIIGGANRKSDLLFNDGFGKFTFSPVSSIPEEPFDKSTGGQTIELVCSDINSDGWKDIIAVELDKPFADSQGLVSRKTLVWTNNKNGTFSDTSAQWFEGLTGKGYLTSLEVFDINQDGRPDLLYSAGEYIDDIGLYINNGDKFIKNNLPGLEHPVRLNFTDMNYDGKPDVVSFDYVFNTWLQN